MQRQILLSVGIALANAAKVAGQAAATTASNPLNNFIGAAGAAASQIKSAEAQETASSSSSSSSSTSPSTTSTPPPPAATPSHSAAAASSGLSEGAKIGIIVGCVVGALLILAILAGICCCLVRRRRRNKRRHVDAVEKETSPKPWKSPINPGRHYSNYTPAQRGEVTADNHHPTVPLMAAAATDHHMHSEKAPSLSQHPAMRPQPENPFVPVPPSPRRTEPNQHGSGVRDGLMAGTAAGAGAYAMHEHHNRQSKSPNAPPTYNNNDPDHHSSGVRDGLMAGTATGAGAYAMHEHNNRHSKSPSALPAYNNNNNNPNHHDSGVRDGLMAGTAAGAGAYAIHEHNNRRSTALPTHNNNNPDRPPTPFGLAGFGPTTQSTTTTTDHHPRASSPPYASVGQPYNDMHVHVLQTDPPSRDLRHSLQKHEEPVLPYTTYADSPHHPTYRNSKGYSTPPEVPSRSPNRRSAFADSSYDSSLSTTTSSNDSGYARYSDPYAPRQRESIQPYLQQHQPQPQPFGNNMMTRAQVPPPAPVEYQQQGGRRTSHSPRGSRSPAVSINGQPRRLRFEDLHPQEVAGGSGAHDSWDGYGYGYEGGQRWSQGVGEAL